MRCLAKGKAVQEMKGIETGWKVEGVEGWEGWKVEGGRWKVEGGRWKVEGGRWKVEGGRWKVEGGRAKGDEVDYRKKPVDDVMPPPPKAVVDFEVPEELPKEEVSRLFPSNITQKFRAWDARSIAVVPPYIITSPNMDYVPSYIFGSAELRAWKDGRWGYVDPFQTPQDFADEFPWVALIPRRDCIHDAKLKDYVWVIWHRPAANNIRKEHRDHPEQIGRLSYSYLDAIKHCAEFVIEKADHFQKECGRESGCCKFLVSAIRRNMELLDHVPMYRRDIILLTADFQQCFLDLYAYLTFQFDGVNDRARFMLPDDNWDVNTDWMGAFTDRASLAFTLFQAGIPVWLVRHQSQIPKDIRISFPSLLRWDQNVVTKDFKEQPCRTIHTGVAGQARAYLSRPTGMVETSDYSTMLPTESLDEWHNHSNIHPSTALPSSSSLLPTAAPAPAAMPAQPPSPPMHPRQRGRGVIEEMSNDLLNKLSERLVGDIAKAITPSISGDSTWEDVTSIFLPDLDPRWNMGIARIDRSPHQINTAPPISGYPFPDVAVFGRTTSAARAARYTANWLFCRIPWARAVEASQVPYPSTKMWREFLNGLPQYITDKDPGSPSYAQYRQLEWLQPPPFDPNQKGKSQECRDSRARVFGARCHRMVHVSRRIIPVADILHLPPEIMKVITWEINELGFRYELLAMDRIKTLLIRSDAAVAKSRDALVANVFDSNSLLNFMAWRPPHYQESGFTTPLWERRVRSIWRLRAVMEAWPGSPARFKDATLPSNEQADFEAFECIVIDFYLQSVFDMWGRRPTIPRIPPPIPRISAE
ncbi:hypothetical protein BU15DRAFT_79861 [Melanogaster broomeanus]|nr:hypothetical protein BU15DRAFT_79861 [Melanogaster broomeanus]